MDTLEQELVTLNQKIDTLYEIIRELNQTIIELLSQSQSPKRVDGTPPHLQEPSHRSGFSPPPESETRLEHKDILLDDNYMETKMMHREDPSITADIQIQRLTAQLTAAYNRIAALEERLLAQRSRL